MKEIKFTNVEKAKDFWRWKWKQIMRKIFAGLFIAWAVFSGIGLGVLIRFIGNVPGRVSYWYGIFSSSIILFIIVVGFIVTILILVNND